MTGSVGGQYSHELVNMTRDEFKMLIKDSMREELAACGLLVTTDAERIEAQVDFRFMRKLRMMFDGVAHKIGGAILLGVVGLVGSLLYAGFTAKFGK